MGVQKSSADDAHPRPLREREIRALLTTRDLGRALFLYETLSSTNDEAARLAQAGGSHGTTIIADTQTAGRGRRGRTWISPPGVNLYLSVLLRLTLPASRAPELALIAAVAACETAREAGVAATLKWPNDVLVHGKKLSGILCEMAASGGNVAHAVIGFGMNVNVTETAFPSDLHATSLTLETGHPHDRMRIAAQFLHRFESWLDLHAASGFAPIRDRWCTLASTLGSEVTVRDGDRVVAGRAIDLAADGALIVETAPGLRERVSAGDVVEARR